jgi:protein-disulfide isomerase
MRPRVLAVMVVLSLIVTILAAAGSEDKPKPSPAPGVVAYLGDEAVTLEELDEKVGSQIRRLRQQEYELRRAALDELLAEKLLAREAAARGVTADELYKTEVLDKLAPPTEEEISRLYEMNRSRVGNRTLEQVRPDIEAALGRQRETERRNNFYGNLLSKADVRVLLDPPRVAVSVPPGEPSRGPADAPVTMVEFSAYTCGYCKRAHPVVEQLLEDYGDAIRFVYRDFPLANQVRALPSAVAARCAGDQGKYWEYHDHLMTIPGDLADADLKNRASALGLDVEAFQACTESGKHDARVQAGLQDGAALGVSGTPTFFLNGRMMVGAQPIDEFRRIIEEELDRVR